MGRVKDVNYAMKRTQPLNTLCCEGTLDLRTRWGVVDRNLTDDEDVYGIRTTED